MQRRVHVAQLRPGEVELDAGQSHHVRDVLRLGAGEKIELFDDAGQYGVGTIYKRGGRRVVVMVDRVSSATVQARIVVASAVPKGDRADWMVEKLAELGVDRFIPLKTARSVVAPSGSSKLQRWRRIAVESAKQSRRTGVMAIDELTTLHHALDAACAYPLTAEALTAWFLSTDPGAGSLAREIGNVPRGTFFFLLIGPEGGWTDDEIALFCSRNLTGVKLTATILRVETAAVAAAAVVASFLNST